MLEDTILKYPIGNKINLRDSISINYYTLDSFLHFDWLNKVVRSSHFTKKSFPKDVDYFLILSKRKFKFSQSPSREEIFSLRGWLTSFFPHDNH